MNKIILLSLSLLIGSTAINAEEIEVKSYGHYQKMIHKKNTAGVVDLTEALKGDNVYAVGAIADGLGEITILDNKVYLDYGKDGLGNSLNTIAKNTQAVLLARSQVKKWKSVKIADDLTQKQLFAEILNKAKASGMDIKKPFPFLLEGEFESLKVHAIAGQNPNFGGHGSKQKLFHMAKDELIGEDATIVGFYSANNQGVYTHPNESWHLHAVIEDVGAHVDKIHSGADVILKLPIAKKHSNKHSNKHGAKNKPMQHQKKIHGSQSSVSDKGMKHKAKLHMKNKHNGGHGGGHGGHGSVAKGLDKFPTTAYHGSPNARSVDIVKAPKIKGDPVKGKEIAYNRSVGRCLNCHVLGEDAEQAGNVGPNLSNFGNLGRSDDYIFQQIWDARAHNPQTMMPPLGANGLLSRHQVLHISAYLKTLKKPVLAKYRANKDKLNLLVADRDFTIADEFIEKGEALFNKTGKNGKSCATCHQSDKNSLIGAASNYPKANSKGDIVGLEKRINICRKDNMDSHHYKLGSYQSNQLSSYLKYLSRDVPINVANNKSEAHALKRGKASFSKKTGQLNLSCADCHVEAKEKWLAGQYLNSIAPGGSHKSTAATWPRHFIAGHDLGLISLQQRIRHCQAVTRTYPLKLGSKEYTEMELYLTSLANGSPMLAPTKSNLGNE